MKHHAFLSLRFRRVNISRSCSRTSAMIARPWSSLAARAGSGVGVWAAGGVGVL